MIRIKPDNRFTKVKTGARAQLGRILVLSLLSVVFCLRPAAIALALEPGEGYLTADDGVRLYYKIVGNGPETLVVVHGGPGNSMDSLLPDLAPLAEDRTVIYYDQRGNGRSQLLHDPEQLSIAKHVEDLESLRRHFKLEKMNLLGNSWGGLLVGYYAIAHPDHVQRMVLHSPASPSFRLLSDSTGYIYQRIPEEKKQRFILVSSPKRWVNAMNPLKLCREFYEIVKPVYFSDITKAKSMKGDTCSGPIEAVRLQLLVNKQIWESLGEWNLQPDLGEIYIPTLVIHGEDDMIPVESSRAWAASLPDARLLVIKKTGHMTHIEQPDIFFAAVKTFLAGQWPIESQIIRKDTETVSPAAAEQSAGQRQQVPRLDILPGGLP